VKKQIPSITDALVTTRGTFRQVLILFFCCAWLFMLLAGWILPRFGGQESVGVKIIDSIRWSTGTWQQWNMFNTIPTLRGYQMELSCETSDGERKTYGAVVPDLEALDGISRVRYHYAYSRILSGNQKFLDAYVEQAAVALKAKDSSVKRFTIQLLFQPTRPLDRSRKDGQLWTTAPEQRGPFPLEP
jgi:hypothetical protein